MRGRFDLLRLIHTGNEGYYILFEGSESDLAFWTSFTENPSLTAVLSDAAKGAIKTFVSTCPQFTYHLFPLASIRKELSFRVRRITYDNPDVYVIALSDVYQADGWPSIQINRMIDLEGNVLQYAGPRISSPPLPEQIKRLLAQKDTYQKIVLVDDVCFKGDTAKTLMSLGLRVANIVGGVVTSYALDTLTKRRLVEHSEARVVNYQRSLRIHPVVTVGQVDDSHGQFIDTCPLHDFIPFSPFCGITIGVDAGQLGPLPIGYHGMFFTRPYLRPYLDTATFESKTSIPAEVSEEFSALMLENAIRMYERLDALCGENLTPRVISRCVRNSTYPLSQGESPWDTKPDIPIVDILRKNLAQLKEC